MTLNEYQKAAMGTCMPSSNNFAYMILNLQGEVGEFCSKVAKAIRKGRAMIAESPEQEVEQYNIANPDCPTDGSNHLYVTTEAMETLMPELKKEAGDILWQLAGLCSVCGWSLEEVARTNLEKLAIRQMEGTIAGNGDGCHKGEGRTE